MDWEKTLVETLKKSNAEVVRTDNNKLLIVCPEEMNIYQKANIIKLVPSIIQCEFTASMKPSTLQALHIQLKKLVMMGNAQPLLEGKSLTVFIQGQVNEDATDWGSLDELLVKDGFLDKWDVQVNGEATHSNSKTRVQILQKVSENLSRNNRQKVISGDDILNLNIALNTAETFEDFINSI